MERLYVSAILGSEHSKMGSKKHPGLAALCRNCVDFEPCRRWLTWLNQIKGLASAFKDCFRQSRDGVFDA